MHDAHSNDKTININISFTELFSLIVKSKPTNNGLGLDYPSDEVSRMLLHTDNAITSILHGLQSIGNLVASSSLTDKDDIAHIGYFFTLIANLMEALHVLHADCEFELMCDNKQAKAGA